MANNYLNRRDFLNPTDAPRTGGVPINRAAAHLHLIYILDISGSMDGRKIKVLVDCLNKTLDDLRQRADVSGACDITVITFNEHAELLQAAAPLDQVRSFTVDEFMCEGGTNGWSGLDLGHQQYEERRKAYHDNRFQHYPAQVVYMSDGCNNVGSDINGAVDEFLALQQPHGSRGIPKVNFIPIGFGADADLKFLKGLNIKGEAALANNKDDLDFIFDYLTSSCIYLSSTDPDQAVSSKVPTPDRVDAMQALLAKQTFMTS